MEVRRRIFGIATMAGMLGALGIVVVGAPVAASSAAGAGVTFTSQSGSSTVLAHYVVTPASRGAGTASSSAGENRTITLSPKGDKLRQAKIGGAGVASGNNVTDTTKSDTSGNPPLSASFIGQQGSATTCSYFGPGCNPPDMALGASPKFVLQGVNSQWEVLDTAGHVQAGWPVSAQSFFGVPNETVGSTPCDTAHGSQPFMSDPRALYDSADGRFWAAMLQVENALAIAPDCPFKSVYYVAVSQTSNPNGNWNVYEFDMTMNQPLVADYTQLGINGQAVYFSANMFGQDGSFYAYAELFEANKAQMEKNQGNFTADGFFNLRATGPGTTSSTGPFLADTVQPTDNIDGSTGSSELFVDTLDGPDPVNGHFCGFFGGGFADSCSGLAVWNMANPTAHDDHPTSPAPTLTGSYVATMPFVFPPAANEPGCKQCIDALDLRLTGTPVVRHGNLYGAWETGIGNGTNKVPGIEWAQVKLSDLSSTSNYYDFTGDAAASFGTVMPDAHGNVTMLFEHMSHSVNPETRYIVKGADQINFQGPGVLLKAGESPYRPTLCGTAALPVCRWGDFEAASFDGSGHIWFAGEYANHFQGVSTPPAFGRNWGTWIGAIKAS